MINKSQTKEYRKKYNDVLNKKWNPINHPKLIRFKGKLVVAKEKPNREQCQICNKRIGDEYTNCEGEICKIKRIHTHHKVYHDDDVLKDTISICASCHGKESWRIRKLK